LVEGGFKGDEPACDEVTAGLIEGECIHGKTGHHGGIGIEAQALAIGYGDQKQVEGRRRMGDGFNKSVTDQPVIHPAELAGDLSDTVWTDGVLLDHHFLL